MSNSLELFHPIIQKWFVGRFRAPTRPQQEGWPAIVDGKHVLIAAPTGSGKTLTAFLASIDRLFRRAVAGELTEGLRVVYLSPLRALSNDMHRNLEQPLLEIFDLAHAEGLVVPPIRVGLRTGDTKSSARAALIRRPPHILVTTPESLYLMLTSPRGRERLADVETVIVDEIHALVRDKRGSHMALTLERLAALCPQRIQRIGLSATQRPIERVGDFLIGGSASCAELQQTTGSVEPIKGDKETGRQGEGESESWPQREPVGSDRHVEIIDVGHQRDLDLAIEVPPSELGAICMHEQWAEVNLRICELINSHRSTLIFVNARRLAERLTHQLSEILGPEAISSHHGSLAADHRHDTEQRLKSGQLKAVVATASLELGLDVGYIDLVIQIGSPRSIATFLQRVGRSGHALGLTPKGRLFALTRDELMENMAVIRAVRAGRLDITPIPEAPLDILAQQIVAEVACAEWGSDELYDLYRRAWPYRNLSRTAYDSVLDFLSEGMARGAGRSRQYLHYDRVGRRLRARPGARISAATCGGAIPEIASYRVVAEPEKTVVGTLDEEFATESQAGEIFLLGNTSWRIQYVRGGDVVVTDAQGAPPTIPFWRGEGPGRTLELSEEVSRLREDLEARLTAPECHAGDCSSAEALSRKPEDQSAQNGNSTHDSIADWLMAECGVTLEAASQMVTYVAAQHAAIGLLPTQKRIVFERFFDESGGMQLVIHAPFGSRICRAWGLAMRKRFCRSFDFELQANADDDGVVLSLGPQHSFPLESMFGMLTAENVQALLQQALLFVPTFQTRWRWNVMRALLVLRMQNGRKVPPSLLRFRADDLLTAIFPKLTGCQENVVGDLELPDHPLCQQSMQDSLIEPCDIEGLRHVLGKIESGEIELLARDTREPSPFSYELLNVNPYAFLDGGEAAERRTRAVATRRSLTVESVSDLGRLDPEAIQQVRIEARPYIRSADELHDVLLSRVALPVDEVQADWNELFEALVARRRATVARVPCPTENGETTFASYWVAAERLPPARAAFPGLTIDPVITTPVELQVEWQSEDARVAIVRGLIEICGPITADEIASQLGFTTSQAEACLMYLEGEGVVLRGRFNPRPVEAASESGTETDGQSTPVTTAVAPLIEWCHRRLLARIHRLTIEGLRRQIQPVTVDIFIRFLFQHHGLIKGHRRSGTNGLFEVVSQLQGLDIPAVSWERDVLPARLEKFRAEWLDELCLTGELGWGRLYPARRLPDRARSMASVTRVVPVSLYIRADSHWLQQQAPVADANALSSPGQHVFRLLQSNGAMFAADLLADTRMLPCQLSDVLGELVSHGLVTADGFAGLRNLLAEKSSETRSLSDRFRQKALRSRAPLAGSGRWSLWRREAEQTEEEKTPDPVSPMEQWAWQLLRRWGVLFRDLLEREDGAPKWFELLQVLRRLEARGEIRGGRFITGVAGEQFALGDTVKRLRQIRDDQTANAEVSANEGRGASKVTHPELVIVSGADPLNLAGILTPHARVPSTASNRLAYVNGIATAALVGGEIRWLTEPTPAVMQLFRNGEVLRRGAIADLPPTSSPRQPDPVVEVLNSVEPDAKGAPRPPKKPKTEGRKKQHTLFPNQIPRPRY